MIMTNNREMVVGLSIGFLVGSIDYLIDGGLQSSLDTLYIIEHFLLYPLLGLTVGYWANSRNTEAKQLRQREKQLAVLNRASSRISRWGLDLDGILQAITSSLVDELNMAFARIWLANENEQVLLLRASSGLYTRLDGSRACVHLSDYPYKLAQIAVDKQPLVTNHVQQDSRFEQDWAEEQGLVAFAGYPLCMNDHLIAVLVVFNNEKLDESILDVLGSFANQAAVAIENARLYQDLKVHSQTLEQMVQARTAELQQEKERSEAILNSVADAILLGDLKGCILSVNPAFERQTGYQSSEVIGKRFHILASPSIPPSTIEADKKAALAGRSWRGEVVIRRKDGTEYDAEVSRAPLYQNGEMVRGYVVVIHDISDHKNIERMKDDFVSNVSHELRTPITSIKLYHHLLTLNPDQRTRYLPVLKRETERLQHIVENLLTLSRLDQKRIDIEFQLFDLNDLFTLYTADRDPLAGQKDQKLIFEPEIPLSPVQADPKLLEQVLSILLTNAFSYTPDGGQVVVRTYSRQIESPLRVGFSVSDTGPGIPLHEQRHLFDRFFRGVVGKESRIAGTGLGLAIAKEIIDQHQGHIEVESQGIPGQGTTFMVWLPVEGRGENSQPVE